MVSKIIKKAEQFLYTPSKMDILLYTIVLIGCYTIAIIHQRGLP